MKWVLYSCSVVSAFLGTLLVMGDIGVASLSIIGLKILITLLSFAIFFSSGAVVGSLQERSVKGPSAKVQTLDDQLVAKIRPGSMQSMMKRRQIRV